MGQEIYWTNTHKRVDGCRPNPGTTLYNLGIDYDFIPLFDMKLKAGRPIFHRLWHMRTRISC